MGGFKMEINLSKLFKDGLFLQSLLVVTLNSVLLILIRIFYPSNLLFDQILILCFLSFIAFFLAYVCQKYLGKGVVHRVKTGRTTSLAVLLGVLIFYIFGTGVLLNVDRSRSLYIFQWVDQCSNSLRCIDNYQKQMYGNLGMIEVNQRIEEQISRGLMTMKSEQVFLTSTGKVIENSADLVAWMFNLEGYKNARIR
jgi:hypothetical protein